MAHHHPIFLCIQVYFRYSNKSKITLSLPCSSWQANTEVSRPADGYSNKFTSYQAYKGLTHPCFCCVVLHWAIKIVLKRETANGCFQGYSICSTIYYQNCGSAEMPVRLYNSCTFLSTKILRGDDMPLLLRAGGKLNQGFLILGRMSALIKALIRVGKVPSNPTHSEHLWSSLSLVHLQDFFRASSPSPALRIGREMAYTRSPCLQQVDASWPPSAPQVRYKKSWTKTGAPARKARAMPAETWEGWTSTEHRTRNISAVITGGI